MYDPSVIVTASAMTSLVAPFLTWEGLVERYGQPVYCRTCKIEMRYYNPKELVKMEKRCHSCFRKHVAMKALKGRR